MSRSRRHAAPRSSDRLRSLFRLTTRRAIAALAVVVVVAGVVTVTAIPAQAATAPITNVVLAVIPTTQTTVATTTGNPCDASVGTCGAATTISYGQGTAYRLSGFSVGASTFQTLPTRNGYGYPELLRGAGDTDVPLSLNRQNIFDVSKVGAPFNSVVSNDPNALTMAQVLSSDSVTEGSDNTFANTGTLNQNDVERISFMRSNALSTTDPTSVGLTLAERGGNDPFKVAVVTAVDASGNPTAWGSLVSYANTIWGTGKVAGDPGVVLAGVPSTVFRKDATDTSYRPTTITTAQNIDAVYIPLSDLGVTANQKIYGISLLPGDATSASTAGPTNTDGTTNGGIDLVGGVFATSKQPTASPATSTGIQGATQTETLTYKPGDIDTPIDTTKTVLNGPGGLTGTDITVPNEGEYILNQSTGVVTFKPTATYIGTLSDVTYTVTDQQGAIATSTLSPTVTPVTPKANPDTTSGKQGAVQNVNPFTNDTAGNVAVPLDTTSLKLLNSGGTVVSSVTIANQGTYTTSGNTIVFTPLKTWVGAATPVNYQIADANGTTATSTYTPTVTAVTPTAKPDATTGLQGATQSVNAVTNDIPGDAGVPLDATTLTLLDTAGNPATTVTNAQGTYSLDASHNIVFAPVPTFTGVATPVDYRVADQNGTTTKSNYTPTVTAVTPVANPDTSSGPQATVQSVTPMTNDKPGDASVPLNANSLTLLNSGGTPVSSVTIANQGMYTMSNSTTIVFTPLAGFTGAATPVDYRIADANGTTAHSTYTPTVTPVTPTANPDTSTGKQGAVQKVNPLGNDTAGSSGAPLVPGSLTLLDASNVPAASVTVAGGVYTIDASDNIVFTPSKSFVGTAPAVSYRVADQNGTTASSTYTPTVTAITPTANPDTSTGIQNTPQTRNPFGNDTAGDASAPLDTSSLTLLTSPSGTATTSVTVAAGVYTVSGSSIVFTPNASFVGTATAVNYRIADSNGTTAKSTYTPTVTAVTPIANPDTTTGPQASVQSIDPLVNDGAGDASAPLVASSLTLLDSSSNPVTSIVVANQGQYTLSGGKIVFTPLATFTGVATPAPYRVADSNGTTATSTYTPTVTVVNPNAQPDATTGIQGAVQTVNPLANDTPGSTGAPLVPGSMTLLDSSGTPASSVTVAEGVYTTDASGNIVFTPKKSFSGVATPVGYRVTDTNGSSAKSTYTPTVTAVTPSAKPDTSSGAQNKPQSVNAVTNDVAGDSTVPLDPSTLTLLNAGGNPVATVIIPNQGTYSSSGGTITFTPLPSFTGTASPVTYRVADSNGTTTTSTDTASVTAVTPTADPDTSTGKQGIAQKVDPLANDTAGAGAALDPTTLTLLDASNAPAASVTVAGGVYTIDASDNIVFTPSRSFVGTAPAVSYRVADVNGTKTSSTYTPSVTAVTPQANPDSSTGPQATVQSVDALHNDTAGDPAVPLDPSTLTLLTSGGTPTTSVTIAGQGQYTISATGDIQFTPLNTFTGPATPVDYRVADANGTTSRSTYSPTVTVVTPNAVPDVSTGLQGKPQKVDPLANDTPGSSGAPLDPSTLTLLDGAGNPVTSVTIPLEGKYTIDSSGDIVFTPVASYVGTPTPVDYGITDTNGETGTSTYTPTVTKIAPNAVDDTSTGAQNTAQTVDAAANDVAGDPSAPLDPSSFTLLTSGGTPTASVVIPNEGTYTSTGTSITFTPLAAFTGPATPVSYRIADSNGTTDTAIYTPTVNAVTPTAKADATTGKQGATQQVDPLANDTPGSGAPLAPATLTLLDATNAPVASVTIPNEGKYTISGGDIVFTPVASWVGTATAVGYRVADSNGTTATSTYTPTVTAVVPVANPDNTHGDQGATQQVNPLANDTAGDASAPLVASTLTLLTSGGTATSSVTVANQGTYTIDASHNIVFTPLPAFTGAATPVDYRVADGNGTTAASTYTPTVVGVDPVATPDTTSGIQGAVQSIDPLANDSAGSAGVPLDASTLQMLDSAGNAQTSIVIAGKGTYTIKNGKLVFTPLADFVGTPAPVAYSVADANGTVAKSTYTPTVTAIVPVANPDSTTGVQGAVQSINPLTNDTAGDSSAPLVASSLTLLDAGNHAVASVAIPNVGTYTIAGGKIVFTPLASYFGTPTPVDYSVADSNGTTATSTYSPTVTPAPPIAKPDHTSNKQGVVQTVNPLGNDTAGSSAAPLVPGTLTLLDGSGNPVTSVTIPGEGTYTVVNGTIEFAPVASFVGTATGVTYRVGDTNGTTTTAIYTPTVTGSKTGTGTTSTTDPTGLAFTGVSPMLPLGVALALLLAGAAVFFVGRRFGRFQPRHRG